MLRRISAIGLTTLLLVVYAVSAQPPGGPPPGGFRGPGFGGPPGQESLVMLLRMPEVRKEIGSSDKQNKQIDELIADLQRQMQASFTGVNFQAIQDLKPEERQKIFDEARKKSQEAGKKADEKMKPILDGKQWARLNQLQLQRQGVAALVRPDIVKQLGLSDEQKGKIQALSQNRGGPFGPGGDAGAKALTDAVAVLTADQKSKWQELTGKEFKFPAFGFGGPMRQKRTLVKQFDKDKNGRLNQEERKAARDFLKQNRPAGGPGGFGMRGPGTPFGKGRERREPAKPGPRLAPSDVPSYPNASLYEPAVLRTLFLEFEGKDWEAEMAEFKDSDVEVSATLIVDGVKYPNVGVRFRGMSSFGGVPAGYKRSLNVSLDFVDPKQRLYGYKTLNLLNSHEDSSFLSTVLYSHIARQHIPAPKANFVKVVLNGESWGIYVNTQQFNKDFIVENYKSSKGARWKVRGPGGGGGLEYLGDKIDDYKRRYEIKSKEDEKAWKALIELCRTLKETPPDKLEAALKPMLDIDGALWFLALDVVLTNNDGYWVRASDYTLYHDGKGVFHLIPHDMNEAFQGASGFGPGFGPGPGGGAGNRPRPSGVELDPLIGLDDARKPLRSRLLAVPALRARYLRYVRNLAEEALDWKNLGPTVAQYRSLLEKEIEADTRKLSSYDAFRKAVADAADTAPPQGQRPSLSLRTFAEQRRRYLLNHLEVKSAKAAR